MFPPQKYLFTILLVITCSIVSACKTTHKPGQITAYTFDSKSEARVHWKGLLESGAVSKDVYARKLTTVNQWDLPESANRDIDDRAIISAYIRKYQNHPVAVVQRRYNSGSISKNQANSEIDSLFKQAKAAQMQRAYSENQKKQQQAAANQYYNAQVAAARITADGQRRAAVAQSLSNIGRMPYLPQQPQIQTQPQRPPSYDIYDSTGVNRVGTLRPQSGIAPIATSNQRLVF